MDEIGFSVLRLSARPLAWCCGRLQAHDAVDPLSVVGDDSVNPRLLQLATLLPPVGRDADHHVVVEQRTPRISLEAQNKDKSAETGSCIIPKKKQNNLHPTKLLTSQLSSFLCG